MPTINSIHTLILLHDQTLSMLREFWLEAKESEKSSYEKKINVALDHRLELMQARDNQEN